MNKEKIIEQATIVISEGTGASYKDARRLAEILVELSPEERETLREANLALLPPDPQS